MSYIKYLLIIVVTILTLSSEQQARDWYVKLINHRDLRPLSKIEPMISTRNTVRNLVANVQIIQTVDHFETKRAEFSVEYSDSECKFPNGQIVDNDIVVGIEVFPEVKIRVSSLKIPLHEFTKSHDPHTPTIDEYVHSTLGLKISVQNGNLDYVSLFPTPKLGIDCKGT